MKKFFIIILIICSLTNIKAYENDIFKIDVDESYNLETQTTNAYKWTKDNKYIMISINDNTKLRYDIEKYTKEDIQNQKKYFEEGINKGISKYNITASITDINKLNNDNVYYLEYDIYYPSKDAIGYDMYQKGRMYTTNKYILTIIYSSDTKIESDSECTNILNSLNIFDTYEVNQNNYNWFIYTFIFIGVSLGMLGAIISTKKAHK